jgi:formate dehydrogenase maturation protein FdhE
MWNKHKHCEEVSDSVNTEKLVNCENHVIITYWSLNSEKAALVQWQ